VTSGLTIAPGVSLPLDAATETFGILAKKGAGKSNAAVVMAEEMWGAGIPWVAIDPKGDWWGLRSSEDGAGPGLPIIVFGGRHGDVPLEPSAGALIADLVLGERLTCVLDVSEFSKADTTRFLLAFADRLYRQAEDEPLHLFLEEAHEYLPQMVRGDQAALVGAWQRIVKQGRFKGIGCTLVSQRSASLNKDVLTQVDTLIVLRTTSPQDRAAVKAWVDVHADAVDMLATLPSLESGEAWLWSPEFLGKLERIRFRRRRTFDSGATPKVGKARRTPRTLADVDLAAIKEAMAETIEKAKADDPKELRRQIAALRKELTSRPTETVVETVVERVDVPVLDEGLVLRLEEMLSPATALLAEVQERLRWETSVRDGLIEYERKLNDRKDVPRARPAGDGAASVERSRPAQRPDPAPRREPRRQTVPRAEGVSGPQQRILDALAWFDSIGIDRVAKTQLALFADASPKSSAYANNLGALRSAGLIDYPMGGYVCLTDAGEAAAEASTEISTTEELLTALDARLSGPQARIVRELADCYPDALERDALAARTGASPTSSAYANNLGALRSLGLIDYPQKGTVVAQPVLFL
jgi:hypothetical protein